MNTGTILLQARSVYLIVVMFALLVHGPSFALESPLEDSVLELSDKPLLFIAPLSEQLSETGPELSLQSAMQSDGWQRDSDKGIKISKPGEARWLRVSLRNGSESGIGLRLDTGLPTLTSVDIWLIRSDQSASEQLLSLKRNDPFSARSVVHRHIAGEFSLASEETATVVLRVAHEFPRTVNVRLISTAIAAQEAVRDAAFSGGYHALMLGMLILTVASRRLVGNAVVVSFAAYLITSVLLVLSWEQQLFRFVFNNNRSFDIQFWGAMLSLMLAAQLQFGRRLFDLRSRAPGYDKLVLLLVVINCAAATMELMMPTSTDMAFQLVHLSRLLCSIGLHFGTAWISWQLGLAGSRLFVLSGVIIVASVLLRLLGMIEAESMLYLIRLMIVAESIVFTIALVQRATGLLRQRDEAKYSEMKATRRELATARALNDSERAYAETSLLADQYASRLATVGHDIKQPLVALRLSLGDGLRKHRGVIESLEYLERLALSESRTHDEQAMVTHDVIDVRRVTDKLVAMFESDMKSGGLQFEYKAGDFEANAATDGLALMRVVANLLSNAVRHAKASKICLSLSCDLKQLHIDIVDDGIGMDQHTLNAAMQRHVRAATSEGQGLGLDIVRENCRIQDYELNFQSSPGSGTRVQVTFPRAD